MENQVTIRFNRYKGGDFELILEEGDQQCTIPLGRPDVTEGVQPDGMLAGFTWFLEGEIDLEFRRACGVVYQILLTKDNQIA